MDVPNTPNTPNTPNVPSEGVQPSEVRESTTSEMPGAGSPSSVAPGAIPSTTLSNRVVVSPSLVAAMESAEAEIKKALDVLRAAREPGEITHAEILKPMTSAEYDRDQVI